MLILILRNIAYWLIVTLSVPVFGTLAPLLLPFPRRFRHYVVSRWAFVLMWGLRHVIGLNYRVTGAENIPSTPSVIACKHQSGWETLTLQAMFPPQVWVAKKELMWIPFLGWGLACINSIMIDRKNKASANRQLLEQGRERVEKDGFWIVVFPEGTRMPAGKRGKYRPGAARLARELDIPLVPVAHNSGEFWPRNSFLKYPGEITVVIGPPIMPEGRGPEALTREVENWIEARQTEISGVGPFASAEDKARRAVAQPA